MSRLQIFFCIALVIALSQCAKLCRSGWEGEDCNVITRDKFEGVWHAADTPGNLVYVDTIYNAPAIGNVWLSGSFAGHHFANPIGANAGGNTLTIPYQQPDGTRKYVQGAGQINAAGDTLNWAYQLTDSTQLPVLITNFAGVWTR